MLARSAAKPAGFFYENRGVAGIEYAQGAHLFIAKCFLRMATKSAAIRSTPRFRSDIVLC
jgi:hypothetical protein